MIIEHISLGADLRESMKEIPPPKPEYGEDPAEVQRREILARKEKYAGNNAALNREDKSKLKKEKKKAAEDKRRNNDCKSVVSANTKRSRRTMLKFGDSGQTNMSGVNIMSGNASMTKISSIIKNTANNPAEKDQNKIDLQLKASIVSENVIEIDTTAKVREIDPLVKETEEIDVEQSQVITGNKKMETKQPQVITDNEE